MTEIKFSYLECVFFFICCQCIYSIWRHLTKVFGSGFLPSIIIKEVKAGHSSPVAAPKKVMIHEHLTPKKQDLFNRCKEFQQKRDYKYCWIKNSRIFLRQCDGSEVVCVSSEDVLNNMYGVHSKLR